MTPGPHDEFLRQYRPVHDAFVRYCSSHAYGVVDAEDLVQDAVLATMKHFHTIREKRKLLPYMITVANNLVRARLRRRKFDATLGESQLQRLEAHVTDPGVLVDIRFLYQALARLPLLEKEAVLLFEVSGFSMREVAGIQRCSEGAARVRIHRARQKLKASLAAEGTAWERGGRTLFTFLL